MCDDFQFQENTFRGEDAFRRVKKRVNLFSRIKIVTCFCSSYNEMKICVDKERKRRITKIFLKKVIRKIILLKHILNKDSLFY